MDEDIGFKLEAENIQPIDFDDEIISNIIKKILIKNPLDITNILEKVKQNIYSALINYWNNPSDLGLMVALLDPHCKSLDFLGNDSEKEFFIQRLCGEFSEFKEPTIKLSTHLTHLTWKLQHVYIKNIFNNVN